MKFESVKSFYKKNKDVIVLAVITALILLANFFKFLWPIATVFLIFFFITSSFSDQICYIVFLSVFSGVSQIYISAVLLCFLITTVRYVLDVKHGRKKFFKVPFFLTVIFLIVFSLIHGKINVTGFFNWGLVTCLLFFIYFMFIYAREINIKKCFVCLFISLCTSAVLGLALSPIDEIRTKIYPFDGTYFRLRLFTLNVNHLAMFCLFEIVYVVYEIINYDIVKKSSFEFLKNKFFWIHASMIAIMVVIGILSLSKAFLLMLFLVFVYFMVFLIIKLRLKSLAGILPILGIVAAVCVLFKDFGQMLVSRFFAYDIWDTFFSKIFSGRTGIWSLYRDHIRGSIFSMLFGSGLLTQDLVAIGPHNVFIYFVFRVGFVGIIMLGTIVYFYIKEADSKLKITYQNSLLLIVFIVLSLEEMIFSDRFFIFFIFGLLLASQPKRIKKPKNNEGLQNNDEKLIKNDEKDNKQANNL